jgi:hypothetical protein
MMMFSPLHSLNYVVDNSREAAQGLMGDQANSGKALAGKRAVITEPRGTSILDIEEKGRPAIWRISGFLCFFRWLRA